MRPSFPAPLTARSGHDEMSFDPGACRCDRGPAGATGRGRRIPPRARIRKMRKRLHAAHRALVSFETCAVGALMVAVCVVVLLQVLMRYLFASTRIRGARRFRASASSGFRCWGRRWRWRSGRTSGSTRSRRSLAPRTRQGGGGGRAANGRAALRTPAHRHGHRAHEPDHGRALGGAEPAGRACLRCGAGVRCADGGAHGGGVGRRSPARRTTR